MKDALTIRNLDYIMRRDLTEAMRILELMNKGFVTSQFLLDKGMYSCFSCGHLNSIDGSDCNVCGEEKFIYTAQEWAYQKRKSNLK